MLFPVGGGGAFSVIPMGVGYGGVIAWRRGVLSVMHIGGGEGEVEHYLHLGGER